MSNFSDLVIVHFFQVPINRHFRYNREFWKRVGMNDAVGNYGRMKHFETVTPVGIFVIDLPKDVKPLTQEEIKKYGK